MDNYEVAFGLILNAGNSKAKSMEAIEAAKKFKFDEAVELLKEAQEELRLAHKQQTGMIAQEASGDRVDVNIIMVHAQDHLTTAMITMNQAEEFIEVYKTIYQLSEKLNNLNKLGIN